LRDDRFRYTRYRNGQEELYDHSVDPHEFKNLAPDPAFAPVMTDLRKYLPPFDAPEVEYASAAEKSKDINRWNDAVLDDDGANGHFALHSGILREIERFVHHFAGFGQRHVILLA
jgi:hypothetical protein